jgi:hypothetical protein
LIWITTAAVNLNLRHTGPEAESIATGVNRYSCYSALSISGSETTQKPC